MTTPNYQFVGAMAHGLNLTRLRTSAEFRKIEASVASKYDAVFVVMAPNVVPFTAWPSSVRWQEVTGNLDRIGYIYIDTTTQSVKQEDGIWKAMSAEQVFAHALAHRASDLPPDGSFFSNRPNSPTEAEAVSRTNVVTQEADLGGGRGIRRCQVLEKAPIQLIRDSNFPTDLRLIP